MNSILQQRPQPLVSLSSDFEVHLLLVGNCGENRPPARQTPPLPHGLTQQPFGAFLARSPKGLAASGDPGASVEADEVGKGEE